MSFQAAETFDGFEDTGGDPAEHHRAAAPPAALDLTYEYDNVGNVKKITDPRLGMTQTFTYDGLDRLTSGVGPWGLRTWEYDAAGNRTKEGPNNLATYHYNASTRRLDSISGPTPESFQYDALGRLTQDARGTYTYNISNLLKTFTAANVTAAYGYDPSGLRISRTVNGVTTYTIRGAAGQTLSEYEAICATRVWTRDAIYAAGRLIGAVKAIRQTATVKISSPTAVSVGEAGSSVNVTLKLTTSNGAPLTCPVTAAYTTATGTAAPGKDFGTKTGTIAFAAGTASNATQVVTIPIVQDTLDEDNETLSLNLSSVTGGTVGTPARADITITDDDATPSLNIADVQVYEGQTGTSVATMTVSLSAMSGREVKVSYASSPGTAQAGVDYQSVSGQLTFGPEVLTQTFTVPISADGIAETNETVTLTLAAPINAILGDAVGVLTILNDDAWRSTWGDIFAPRDGAADTVLFNPGTRLWAIRDSNTGTFTTIGPFGDTAAHGDVFVPEDFTGDGVTDCAFYRPATGYWTIRTSCQASAEWGGGWGAGPTDVPIPADFDGDGKADFAYYRRATAQWVIAYSGVPGTWSAVEWGWTWTHVIPVPGDYDGDGKADLAYYAGFNGSWWILQSSTGTHLAIDWGIPGATVIPTPGDYDDDGKTDLAYYDPSTGFWHIVRSSTGVGYTVNWGHANQPVSPVPADYDADGKTDPAFYTPAERAFYILPSASGIGQWIPMATVSAPGAVPVLKRPQ